MIKFYCQHCNQKLSVPQEFANTDVDCPRCLQATSVTCPHSDATVVKFFCPHCDQKLSVPTEVQGENLECPACNNTFLVPVAEDECVQSQEPVTMISPAPLKTKRSKIKISKARSLPGTPTESANKVKAKKRKGIRILVSSVTIIFLFMGLLFSKDKKNIEKKVTDLSVDETTNELQVSKQNIFSKEEVLLHESMVNKITPFMDQYCLSCHNDDKQKGGIQLDNIDYQISDHSSVYVWQDVLDVLNVGEMPPKNKKQPQDEELKMAISLITDKLQLARKRLASTGGAITMRHLNKREYYGSLKDLFGGDLPDELLTSVNTPGFDTNGSYQFFSSKNYESFMNVGKLIIAEVLKTYSTPISEPSSIRYDPEISENKRHQDTLDNLNKTMALIKAGASLEEIGIADAAQVKLFTKRYEKSIIGPTRYLSNSLHKTGVTKTLKMTKDIQSGALYKITIAGRSIRDAKIPVTVNSKDIGDIHFKASKVDQLMEIPFQAGLLSTKLDLNVSVRAARGGYVDYVLLKGPFRQNHSFAEALIRPALAEKKLSDQDVKTLLKKFADRAFRYQGVEEEYIEALLGLYKSRRHSGSSVTEALTIPLASIISAPAFLYLKEQSTDTRRQISQKEFAVRLAYFLWSSPPDKELYNLAQTKQLYNSSVLKTQMERMLSSEKAKFFLASFINQWAGLRRFDEVDLPREFQGPLRASIRQELSETFKVLVKENLPVDKIIDADFIVIDKYLARFYNMKGEFDDFQKVKVPVSSPRGGMLTQAAFLIMGSSAQRTSPTIRGTLIREKILNDPPPEPPPNVPEIETAKAGDFSVRELVQHHQSLPQCSSCHDKIDPIGLGLENFDHLGRWRTTETLGNVKPAPKKKRGKKVPAAKPKTVSVDASGYLPGGEHYNDFDGFKKALLNNRKKLAESLYESLLSYGIGRDIEFVDRDEIENNLSALARKNYPLKDMIFTVINSQAFKTK